MFNLLKTLSWKEDFALFVALWVGLMLAASRFVGGDK